jgi:hypothetical protein
MSANIGICWYGPIMEDRDWEALAKAVRARRADLGLSQGAVAAAGGPSDFVISRVENNEEPRPRLDTLRKLDRGLRWEPGTSEAFLAGGPIPEPSALVPRVRVKRGGQWIEVDPDAPSAPRTTPEEQLERVRAAARRHSDVVKEILLLPLKLTGEERSRVEHVSTQIAELPEVLAPWLDTPAGMRQFVEQTSIYVDEAQSILGAARERSYPPGE